MIRPATLWFTGLPCSGKTTLAARIDRSLRESGVATRLLDGDEIRRTVSADLGFSESDRAEQARRVAALALNEMRQGRMVVVGLVSPYRSARAAARAVIGDFVEVYVRCPLEVCESRDVKGMYRKARLGLIRDFTGIGSPYEEPEDPEITLDTHLHSIDECADRLFRHLRAAGYLAGANC